MSFTEGGIRWRFPIAFQLVPLIFLAVGINFFPESPRWLVKVGRHEHALEILTALRGEGDAEHPEVQREFQQIQDAVEMESEEGEQGYLEMLFKKDKLNISRRVHLSIWLQIVQELAGIGVVRACLCRKPIGLRGLRFVYYTDYRLRSNCLQHCWILRANITIAIRFKQHLVHVRDACERLHH